MPQRSGTTSNLMRPFVVLALPGMYLLYKYNQYRQQQMETARRRVTERELMHLNTKIEKPQEETALEVPPKPAPLPRPRPGLQVSVLGADTGVGQYIAFLLKQCPPIKKLRLYEAIDVCSQDSCTRDLCQVVQDLQHIDTNCTCEAFRCSCGDLERCLQSTDIVLILENACVTPDMSLEERFSCQAPIIKQYADSISAECPGAFIIVCATPIDCMVPLIAETMKETGWYDPRKLLGSLAVPEMRASTLAARALGLEPRCTRVPCICGTEGKTLVPLFSKAVEHFEFATHNAELMTDAVRCAPEAVARCDGCCIKAAELSEAHAIAGLVSNVAYALLCQDVPIVSGFVETDASQIISPARFIANKVELHGNGIERSLGLPKLCESEIVAVDRALVQLCYKMAFVQDWYTKYLISSNRLDAYQNQFFTPHSSDRLDDCAYANVH